MRLQKEFDYYTLNIMFLNMNFVSMEINVEAIVLFVNNEKILRKRESSYMLLYSFEVNFADNN
jgi:hypothetical protein